MNQRPYICKYESCCEAFHDHGALTRHHRIHVTGRPFTCNYESCGHDFLSSEALVQHSLIHGDESLLACKYDSCDQVFYDREKRIEHHRAHKQRPLACENDSCSRTFARRETLEAHMRMHAKERPFNCTFQDCHKTFCDDGGLIQHEKSHPRKNLPRCDYKPCDQTFVKPFQSHNHSPGEHQKPMMPREEVRPIRLRLTQPKTPSPESVVDSQPTQRTPLQIHLHVEITPVGTSTSIRNDADGDYSGTGDIAKWPDNRSERTNAHHDPPPPSSKSNFGPISETSGKDHLSCIHSPVAAPYRSGPDVHPQAPASQPTIKPSFVGHNNQAPHTDEPSSGHGTSIYTEVCGVYSEEKASPKNHNTSHGSIHCPRCDKQFTRPRGVKAHFVGCITRYGNPDCLRWTDHPSLQRTVKFHTERRRRKDLPLVSAALVRRDKKKSGELFSRTFFRPIAPKPVSPLVEEDIESAEWVCKPDGQESLLQKDIVRPICKHGDTSRRSDYESHRQISSLQKVIVRPIPKGEDTSRRSDYESHRQISSLQNDIVRPIHKREDISRRSDYESHRQTSSLQKDIVRPIYKRRDAFRRSNYNPKTIARDVLLAIGRHPTMDPLNAHLDSFRKRFRAVDLQSNLSTFKWDFIESEQESGKEPKGEPKEMLEEERDRHPEQYVVPDQSALELSKDRQMDGIKDVQWYNNSLSSSPSQLSTKPRAFYDETLFKVIVPRKKHLVTMSKIFSSAFDSDPYARLMSSNGDLWATTLTMLERRYYGVNPVMRAAIMNHTGDLIGWIAYHEVDSPRAKSKDPLTYLDWTTAASLVPSQVARLKESDETPKGKAERLNRRQVGQDLVSGVQARAIEAQNYLIPINRMVINALVVHPSHQRRGVASALLTSITKIADEQERPIWVQTPDNAAVAQGVLNAGLFRRAGFISAGELNLDLDTYASGSDKGKGVSYGSYKWNYMLRLPQPVVSQQLPREPKVPS